MAGISPGTPGDRRRRAGGKLTDFLLDQRSRSAAERDAARAVGGWSTDELGVDGRAFASAVSGARFGPPSSARDSARPPGPSGVSSCVREAVAAALTASARARLAEVSRHHAVTSAGSSASLETMTEIYDLFQQGCAALERGDVAQALVPLEKAKNRAPDKASIRERLGIAYFRLGRVDEAEAEFRALLDLAPNDDYGHYALGRCLEKRGKVKEANGHYKLASSLRPNSKQYRSRIRQLEPEDRPRASP